MSIDLKKEVRGTFNLPKRVEALQSAIDIYINNEACYAIAAELLKILTELLEQTCVKYCKVISELEKLGETQKE